MGCLRSYSENDHDLEIFHAELITHDPFCHGPLLRFIFDDFYLQGPEYEEFIAAAIAEEGTEFLQTTNADIVQLFMKPPFIALRKPQAVNFAAFGTYSIGFHYHVFSYHVLGGDIGLCAKSCSVQRSLSS